MRVKFPILQSFLCLSIVLTAACDVQNKRSTGPQGERGENGKDGTNGKDGVNGKDGSSCVVMAEKPEGLELQCATSSGKTKTFMISNGLKGVDGKSCTLVAQRPDSFDVSCKDQNDQDQLLTVRNGKDGTPGQSCLVKSETTAKDGYIVACPDKDGMLQDMVLKHGKSCSIKGETQEKDGYILNCPAADGSMQDLVLRNGKAGMDGKSCSLVENDPDLGTLIQCPNAVDGSPEDFLIPRGEKGTGCSLDTSVAGKAVIKCGDNSNTLDINQLIDQRLCEREKKSFIAGKCVEFGPSAFRSESTLEDPALAGACGNADTCMESYGSPLTSTSCGMLPKVASCENYKFACVSKAARGVIYSNIGTGCTTTQIQVTTREQAIQHLKVEKELYTLDASLKDAFCAVTLKEDMTISTFPGTLSLKKGSEFLLSDYGFSEPRFNIINIAKEIVLTPSIAKGKVELNCTPSRNKVVSIAPYDVDFFKDEANMEKVCTLAKGRGVSGSRTIDTNMNFSKWSLEGEAAMNLCKVNKVYTSSKMRPLVDVYYK